MQALAFLLLSLAAMVGVRDPTIQPVGKPIRNAANGHYYQVVVTKGTASWKEARDAAEAMSFEGARGHLATITSAEESQFLTAHCAPGSYDSYWIGASRNPGLDPPTEGWKWVNGESWEFTNWQAREPNNVGGRESSVVSSPTAPGTTRRTTGAASDSSLSSSRPREQSYRCSDRHPSSPAGVPSSRSRCPSRSRRKVPPSASPRIWTLRTYLPPSRFPPTVAPLRSRSPPPQSVLP